MPRKKPTASFGDIQPIMKQAVNSEGVRYRVRTYGDAINFRQRCYSYRSRLRDKAADRMGEIPGMEVSIPEDSIHIQIVDMKGRNWSAKAPPKGDKKFPFDVLLTHKEITGELLTLKGEPLLFDEDEPTVEDLGL